MILQTSNPLYHHSLEGLALLREISLAVRNFGGEPVVFFSQAADPMEMLQQYCNPEEYSGVISVEFLDAFDYRRLLNRGMPVVIANCEYSDCKIPVTRIDSRDIGRLGGRALLAAGCRRIGIICRKGSFFGDEIAAGLRGAIAEECLTFDPKLIFMEIDRDEAEPERERERLKACLAGPERPDGLIVVRSKRLMRLFQYCTELGLRIPGDLEVVVYDCPEQFDFDEGVMLLTEPVAELGREAVRMLGEWRESGSPPDHTVCPISMPEKLEPRPPAQECAE